MAAEKHFLDLYVQANEVNNPSVSAPVSDESKQSAHLRRRIEWSIFLIDRSKNGCIDAGS